MSGMKTIVCVVISLLSMLGAITLAWFVRAEYGLATWTPDN